MLSLLFDFALISKSFSFLRTQNSSQFAFSQLPVSGIIFYSAGTIKGLLQIFLSKSDLGHELMTRGFKAIFHP